MDSKKPSPGPMSRHERGLFHIYEAAAVPVSDSISRHLDLLLPATNRDCRF